MQFLSYSTLLLAVPFISHTLAARCPITGSLLPPPRQLSTSPVILAAGERLKTLIDSALSGSIVAGWETNITSFSIILTDTNNGSFWEYHHAASGNANNTADVNGDTQFMVGSVTKVVTDLIMLRLGLDLDEPITKYLPELAYGDSSIEWNEVTLRSLGSHLAAIPRDYAYTDNYSEMGSFESLGFPPLTPSDYPPCGVGVSSGLCTKQQTLAGFSKGRPVFPPSSRPSYSNIGFTLLGYAIEEATGKTYEEVLEAEITKPLGMKNTGIRPKSKTSGVIPPVRNTWGVDLGDLASMGGLYTTTNDLTLLLQKILSLSILDTPSQVRQWLKPMAETASLYSSVGMPWEIMRVDNLTPAHPHITDIYTKEGDVPGYTALIGIISEYGFGFTILSAGLTDAINPLTEALLSTFLPAIEEATRDEANTYVGNFSTPANSTIQSYLVLTMDDGPGLKLTELTRNGSDVLAGLVSVSYGNVEFDSRIYPAGIVDTIASNGAIGATSKEDWRLVAEPLPQPSASELPSQNIYGKICSTWTGHDRPLYGGVPADRFVFLKNGDEVVGIEIPFLRLTLMKQ